MTGAKREFTRDEFEAIAIEAIAKVRRIPAETVRIESTFEELELDSLDAMEVLFEIEDNTGLDIPDTAVRSMRSVREVVSGLEAIARGDVTEPTEDGRQDAPAGREDPS